MANASILQIPGGPNLRTEINSVLRDPSVTRSYALVAFATLSGVQLIGPEPGGALYDFLDRGGTVDWIIGTDSVTTRDALDALWQLAKLFPGRCTIRAYRSQAGLFHPKLYMFQRSDDTGVVFTGSNNLTSGGLVSNTEFAIREDVDAADFLVRRAAFDTVSTDSSATLITTGLLNAVASQRTYPLRSVGSAGPLSPLLSVATDGESEDRVLLRAVPQAGGRFSQVGIPSDVMADFFGLTVAGQTVEIQQQLPGGQFGPIESPPLILSRVNRNRRIEVSALQSVSYPSGGLWPILIFQEVVRHQFYRYLLLMPGDKGYTETDQYLRSIPNQGNNKPSDVIDVASMLEIWPAFPL